MKFVIEVCVLQRINPKDFYFILYLPVVSFPAILPLIYKNSQNHKQIEFFLARQRMSPYNVFSANS